MSKPKSGNLYKHDGQVYVLLNTPLGWLALCLSDLHCFGVPRRRVEAAIDGLIPLGLTLSMRDSVMIDAEIDYDDD